jgi:hypothetical protein
MLRATFASGSNTLWYGFRPVAFSRHWALSAVGVAIRMLLCFAVAEENGVAFSSLFSDQ